jgi:hypothetical protein
MKIELTDEQEQAANEGHPVEVVNPATNRAYLVIAKETIGIPRATVVSDDDAAAEEPRMPPGVERSRDAFLRDLPELLRNQKHDRWFALYHGDSCIRVARGYEDLLWECRRRGLGRDAYYIGIIRHHEPDPEEVEQPPFEYDDVSSHQP